jgi:hypothetical protein
MSSIFYFDFQNNSCLACPVCILFKVGEFTMLHLGKAILASIPSSAKSSFASPLSSCPTNPLSCGVMDGFGLFELSTPHNYQLRKNLITFANGIAGMNLS